INQAVVLETVLQDKSDILKESQEKLKKANNEMETAMGYIMPSKKKEMKEIAAGKVEKATHDLNAIEKSIERDNVELSNLRNSITDTDWIVTEYERNRAEVAEIIVKVFIMQPDHEEEYYSKVLDRAVKLFYKNYTDKVNIKAALRSVTRAHNLMQYDTRIGGGEHINIAAVENMFFSLHFLDLAHSYWPDLKQVEISNQLEDVMGEWFVSVSTARLDILKAHIVGTQTFLNKEL
ncbi:hypothetical protein HK100_009580, partial [Physocladia obscura]